MRLIDADEWVNDFLNVCRTEFEVKNKCMTDENVLHLIYDAPTVEPTITCKECDGYEAGYSAGQHDARPQGEWIEDSIYEGYRKCSNCNCDAEWLDGGGQLLSNFCPNCGADMRGGRA